MQAHPIVADVLVAGGELRGGQLQRDGVDVQPPDGVLHGPFLQLANAVGGGALLAGAAFHFGQQRRQQSAAAAGGVQDFMVLPDCGIRPVHGAGRPAGVPGPGPGHIQRQAGGDGGGGRAGKESAVAGLVAHHAIEQRPGMVGAHIGISFGNALGLGGQMAQGAFQSGQFAGRFNILNDVHGRLHNGAKVVSDDGIPLAPDSGDNISVVFDGVEVVDARQPVSVGDALVQHHRIHQQQSGDGATVGLGFALVLLQIVQAEMSVQGRQQVVVGEMAGGLFNGGFQNVEVADDAVAGEAGFGKEVHPNLFAKFGEVPQFQHLLHPGFGGGRARRTGRWVGVNEDAGILVNHIPALALGLFQVKPAGGAIGRWLVARDAVHPHFIAAVGIALAAINPRRRTVRQRRCAGVCGCGGGVVAVRRRSAVGNGRRRRIRAGFRYRYRCRCQFCRRRLRRGGRIRGAVDDGAEFGVQSAGAVQHFGDGGRRRPPRPGMLPVIDALVRAVGDGHQGMLHRRRLGEVQSQQFAEVVLNALVVGAQGQQDLTKFAPPIRGVAGTEPFLRVVIRRDEDGADDIADLLARRGTHGPAYRLDDINGAFAGLQESDGVERRRISAFAKDAHVDDAPGFGFGSLRQLELGVFPLRHLAAGVQMLQFVGRALLTGMVTVQPILHPILYSAGCQVLGHIAGMVHGVHKGDARGDRDAGLVRRLGRAAHSQGESQSAQVIGGGELAPALAVGLLRQPVGLPVGVRVVDADGDDAVVGQPAVADGLRIALGVQFHAKDGLVAHIADNPVVGQFPAHRFRVIDAGRGGLVDAIDGGESVVIVAQRKVADALLGVGNRAVFRLGGALAAQAGGAMGLVGHQHLRGDAGLRQSVGHPAAALVSAENNADLPAIRPRRLRLPLTLPDPVGNGGGVGSNQALDFRCADIAVVGGGFQGGVARTFLFGVVAGGLVGADRQRAQGDGGVLQVFAPQLRHQRNGRAQHDGQLPRRRQFLDDTQRNAGLAGAARQNDFAPRLADGQAAAAGLLVFPQDADALRHRLILHTLAGLAGRRFAINSNGVVRGAMRARFRGGGAVLGKQVGVNVNQLERALRVGNECQLPGAVAEAVVAVGNQPAFCPELIGGGSNELVQLILADVGAPPGGVQLPRLALDGDIAAVAAADGHGVNADVRLFDAGEMVLPRRPVGPVPAMGNIPIPQMRAGGDGNILQPGAVGLLRAHLVQGGEGSGDDVLRNGGAGHGVSLQIGVAGGDYRQRLNARSNAAL